MLSRLPRQHAHRDARPIWVHVISVVFGLCGWALVFLRMRDDTTFGLDPLPVAIL